MQLIHGDCINAMEQMPDGSVDLILTDPPYNIKVKRTKKGKARTEEWDCIKDYPDFMMRWIMQAHRVLKPQGVMYFFHNDMNQLPEIMERIRKETDFALISFLIWDKGECRAQSWKNRDAESHTALRSWFNTCEYILHYVKSGASKTEWDKTGLDRIYSNPELFRPLKEWYRSELKRLGKTEADLIAFYKQVTGKGSGMFRHYFKDSQFEIPTADVYQKVFVPFGSTANMRTSTANMRTSTANMRTYGANMRTYGANMRTYGTPTMLTATTRRSLNAHRRAVTGACMCAKSRWSFCSVWFACQAIPETWCWIALWGQALPGARLCAKGAISSASNSTPDSSRRQKSG